MGFYRKNELPDELVVTYDEYGKDDWKRFSGWIE